LAPDPSTREKVNAALSWGVSSCILLPVMTRLLFLLFPLVFAGCVPIEVKPIHITVDVNVKVDKALDDFFGDLDRKSAARAY
jgi:hypothetical protein